MRQSVAKCLNLFKGFIVVTEHRHVHSLYPMKVLGLILFFKMVTRKRWHTVLTVFINFLFVLKICSLFRFYRRSSHWDNGWCITSKKNYSKKMLDFMFSPVRECEDFHCTNNDLTPNTKTKKKFTSVQDHQVIHPTPFFFCSCSVDFLPPNWSSL